MNVIGISGLGADSRVFSFLDIGQEIQVLQWLKPDKNEDLSSYAKRLSAQIKDQKDVILIAVSFGGLIAIELQEFVQVKKIILISSMETYREIPALLRFFGNLKLIQFFPDFLFIIPVYLFCWKLSLIFSFICPASSLEKLAISTDMPAFSALNLTK